MATQTLTKNYWTFVQGLITEAGPLTFPENAALSLDNVVLNMDGSIEPRLGLDPMPDKRELIEEFGLICDPNDMTPECVEAETIIDDPYAPQEDIDDIVDRLRPVNKPRFRMTLLSNAMQYVRQTQVYSWYWEPELDMVAVGEPTVFEGTMDFLASKLREMAAVITPGVGGERTLALDGQPESNGIAGGTLAARPALWMFQEGNTFVSEFGPPDGVEVVNPELLVPFWELRQPHYLDMEEAIIGQGYADVLEYYVEAVNQTPEEQWGEIPVMYASPYFFVDPAGFQAAEEILYGGRSAWTAVSSAISFSGNEGETWGLLYALATAAPLFIIEKIED